MILFMTCFNFWHWIHFYIKFYLLKYLFIFLIKLYRTIKWIQFYFLIAHLLKIRLKLIMEIKLFFVLQTRHQLFYKLVDQGDFLFYRLLALVKLYFIILLLIIVVLTHQFYSVGLLGFIHPFQVNFNNF